jgi:Pentapeptide repeats (8 copies)
MDMQNLPEQPRLSRRKVGAARGAAFGAVVGLPLGAVAGVVFVTLADQFPSDAAPVVTGLALYGAILGGVHFALQQAVGKRRVAGPDLRGADLQDRTLSHADLRGADLRGADLRGADLADADLAWARLNGANLAGANLAGTDLRAADLQGATLAGADLSDALLPDGTLHGHGESQPLRWRNLLGQLLAFLLLPVVLAVGMQAALPAETFGRLLGYALLLEFLLLPSVAVLVSHLRRSTRRIPQGSCPDCRGCLTRTGRGGWTCTVCGCEFDRRGRKKGVADDADE